MYQEYHIQVGQFILQATDKAFYKLSQASAENHLEITWATEQSL